MTRRLPSLTTALSKRGSILYAVWHALLLYTMLFRSNKSTLSRLYRVFSGLTKRRGKTLQVEGCRVMYSEMEVPKECNDVSQSNLCLLMSGETKSETTSAFFGPLLSSFFSICSKHSEHLDGNVRSIHEAPPGGVETSRGSFRDE
ncbi:hypothetical protein AUEXF2481DRAFT_411346 [Aureobasidium subglaciale EXF-2481]|uniref:Uncharacterized protein n=1 Tax=Aureobasidium subglaciale (strain EXF-2481) TaxID=1043005 RepID=A0A074Z0M4_AURSE|nr:uncharacterized protein AUEXF2481DRAFT_411346 [Aureobasidium subglaciale EXF-2481]KEQ92611.1 hypothetical protein AUEXF2481DRAFT_411346 [Aureobasidium subglaciale EXF-2481]